MIAGLIGTAKVNEARKLEDIKVVTPNWLWACAERWERVEEKLYPLHKAASVTIEPPKHCSDLGLANELAAAEGSSSPRNLPEALNPFLALSSNDLKGMDEELDEFLSDSSSSEEGETKDEDEDEDKEGDGRTTTSSKRARESDEEDPEELDGLEAQAPRGWERGGSASKRLKSDLDEREEESSGDEDGSGSSEGNEDELMNMAQELERGFADDDDDDFNGEDANDDEFM